MTKLLKIGMVALMVAGLGASALAQGRGNMMPADRGGAGWQTSVNQSGDLALAARVNNLRQNIDFRERQLLATRAAGGDTSAQEALIEGLRHRLQATVLESSLYAGPVPWSYGTIGGYGAGIYPGCVAGYGAGWGWQQALWNAGDPLRVQRITYLQQMLRDALLALRTAQFYGQDTTYLQGQIDGLYSALRAVSLQAGIGLDLGAWNGGAIGGPIWGGWYPYQGLPPLGH